MGISVSVGVQIPIIGFVSLGSIGGDLQKGVEMSIDVFVAKGSVRFYLKNGNQLWVGLSLTSKFFSDLKGDYKIITICGWLINLSAM